MATINFLAQLLGFYVVILSMAMLINKKYTDYIFEIIEDRKNLFVFGVLNIIIGTFFILSYNVWSFNWVAIVIILGWLIFIRGSLILFAPEVALKILAAIKKNSEWFPIFFSLFVALGCFLLYKGFIQ